MPAILVQAYAFNLDVAINSSWRDYSSYSRQKLKQNGANNSINCAMI